ncbi:MAG: hypothetical protein HY301_07875 [Verrucomicrobia bacterium]|nr:hypothetical protein [Verrucomicrobiota bacterium]
MNPFGIFSRRRFLGRSWLGLGCAALLAGGARAADFNVSTPGGAFAFTINGESPNPTLTLTRGRTYTFAVANSSFHPFKLGATTGVTNNNISSGTITYAVPLDAVDTTYFCSFHFFTGTLQFVDPPPVTAQIVGLSLDVSNVTLRSTVSNAASFTPQFNTNLLTTNWLPLSVVTNTSLNGTNETICGRPPGNAVFMRIRAQ